MIKVTEGEYYAVMGRPRGNRNKGIVTNDLSPNFSFLRYGYLLLFIIVTVPALSTPGTPKYA
jgi:hypothetical protein